MNELPCEVVRDLLPSYLDDLTGETSNALLEAHLSSCSECRAALSAMRETIGAPAPAERPELDYLKKQRRHTRLVGLCGFLAALLLFLCAGLVRVYVVGEEASIAGRSGLATELDVGVYSVTAHGSLPALGGKSIRSVRMTEPAPGYVVIAVRVVPESFLFRAREFHTTYHTKAPVTRVEWSDYWLWADGQYIPANQGGD